MQPTHALKSNFKQANVTQGGAAIKRLMIELQKLAFTCKISVLKFVHDPTVLI